MPEIDPAQYRKGYPIDPSSHEDHDPVSHPRHYTSTVLPNGTRIECIDVIEALKLPFHLGNVLKYIWRRNDKDNYIEQLKKARWYLDRYISGLENEL